jgi:hypothetical protein
MNAGARPRQTKLGQSLIAGGMVAIFLWALALSVFPALHLRVHSDAAQSEHNCAVTFIASGSYEHAADVPQAMDGPSRWLQLAHVDGAGRDHPLVALWRRTAEGAVLGALAENAFKVQALFPDIAVRRLPAQVFPNFDLRLVLANVNWPEDLDAFRDA